MITLPEWVAQLRKQSHAPSGTNRKASLDALEARRLLTTVEPIDTVDATVSTSDGLQPFVFVLSSSDGEPVLQSPTGNEAMGPLTLEDSGAGDGYAWVQGSGSGSAYVPGSVLASAGPLDWEPLSAGEETEATDSGWGETSFLSGEASGSGGASSSGYTSAWGSGSGGSSGSGYSVDSGSGSGGTAESGSGSASGSGSGGGYESGSGSGSGGGTDNPDNEAPVIHDFAWTFENGFYTFSGSVTDDQDPAGLTVVFGGILNNYTCSVEADGTFQFVTAIENGEGEATSQVQDHDLAWSNVETVML